MGRNGISPNGEPGFPTLILTMKDDLTLTVVLLLGWGSACFFPATEAQSQTVDSSPALSTASSQANGLTERPATLIGLEVFDTEGQKVGTFNDLVVDLQNNRMPLAIVSTEAGGKRVAVPPQLLSPREDQRSLTLTVSRETFLAGPEFASNADLADSAWLRQTYSYYGQPIYWQPPSAVAVAPSIREPAGAVQVPRWVTGREQDQEADQIFRQYQRGSQQARLTDRQTQALSDQTRFPQYPATTVLLPEAGPPRLSEPAGAQVVPRPPLGSLVQTSDLIGTAVQDAHGQGIGQIADIIIDWPSSRTAYTLVAPGDVTGPITKYYAIPPSALLRSPSTTKILTLNLSKEQLSGAPAFPMAGGPNPANRAALSEIYAYYGQVPYWAPTPSPQNFPAEGAGKSQ